MKNKPKKLKGIDLLSGLSNLIEMLASDDGNPYRKTHKVFRNEENDWVVDTCIVSDTEMWETGIFPPNSERCIIVEQYADEREAEIGHAKWVELMRMNPNRKLEDIGVWEY